MVYLFTPMLFAVLVSIAFLFKSFPIYIYFTILAIIFIAVLIITNKIKLYYLQISDEAGKITLKYLTLGPLGGNRKSIEILICISGKADLASKEGTISISRGESILIPASVESYSIDGIAEIFTAGISDQGEI